LDGLDPETILEGIVQVGIHREEVCDYLHKMAIVSLHNLLRLAKDNMYEI